MARLLAIETATISCSVALFEGDELVAERHELVGRGHAERLIPMIAELPGQGRAETILVDCGPGSFTGVRVGLAAARALGLGWGAEVRGYSSLALLGAAAAVEGESVAVAINGGHGELFVQRFGLDPFRALGELASLKPGEAAAASPERLVLGSGATALVEARGHGEARDDVPRAADIVRLGEAFTRLPAHPIYGRAPDARPKA